MIAKCSDERYADFEWQKKPYIFIKSNHSNRGVTLTLSIIIIDRHLRVRVSQYSRHRDLIVFSVLLLLCLTPGVGAKRASFTT